MSGTLPPVAGLENCTSMGGIPPGFWYQFGWLVLLLLCLAALACGIQLWRIHQMHLCADARDA